MAERCAKNNSLDTIGSFSLQTVGRLGGCPVKLITNLETENELAASIQCFFRNNSEAHQYVASPRNQRIEGLWSQFSKQRTNWCRNFFKDLVSRNTLDSKDTCQVEALWFSFSGLLQEELNFDMEHWNTHSIRKIDLEPFLVSPILFITYQNFWWNTKSNAKCTRSRTAVLLGTFDYP